MAEFRERPEAPADVRAYWNARKDNLLTSFDWRDVWAQEHVQGFAVAKAMKLDVQVALRDAVGQAIEKGVPYEQFAKELTPKLQSLGWWGKALADDPVTGETRLVQLGSPRRLKTIFQANVRSARTAGFWQRAQRTKRVLPYLVYEMGPSEVHRPHHLAQAGKVYPVDHSYWDYWLGPNGWGCKCWARQVSRAEAERLGGVSPETDMRFRSYTNKRTGEVSRMPAGIDPGWHTNPGKSHMRFVQTGRKLDASLRAAAEQAQTLAAAAAARAAIARGFADAPALANIEARGAIFDKIADSDAKDGFGRIAAPLAILPPERAAAMGAKQPVVLLSVHTVAKQMRKSKEEAGRLDWGVLQRIVETNMMRPAGKPLHFYMAAQVDGQWYLAVLKVTHDGEEIYLQSIHRAKAGQIERKFEG